MKKEIKKVLFITDDIREDDYEDLIDDFKQGNYYYDDASNKYSFDVTFSRDFNFKNPYKYDAVLIDYGVVGEEKNVKILERIYRKGIPMAWVGCLPRCIIIEDFEKLFPDFDFASDLTASDGISMDNIMFTLYRIINSEFYEEMEKNIREESKESEDETLSDLMSCDNDIIEAINSFVVLVKLRKYCNKLNVGTVEEIAPKFTELNPREINEYEEEIQDEIQLMLENANKKADIEINEIFKRQVE